VKLQLNTTEMLDWQEVWCFRCKHDHGYSHTGEEDPDSGCPLLRDVFMGDDVAEFHPRAENALNYLPAMVSCDKFELCAGCPADAPDLERREGLTHHQWVDEERERVLAEPITDG
jgi:hypothetical protein